jgi:hypothetical protein
MFNAHANSNEKPSNSNERINVPYSNNKKRPRSVADDGEKDSGLAKNYYGKQYLGGVLPLGELIFLNDGPSKRLIVHPASNRASSLTGEALKKAFIEQKVITRGQYYDRPLIDFRTLKTINKKSLNPQILETLFDHGEIVSASASQYGIAIKANNIVEARNLLKKLTAPTNSLSGGNGENTTIANSSNIDHREEMLLDSNSDALVGGLDSEAVVSQSATCYSNDNDLEKTLELINDEDLEKILELIDKDMAPLFVEQNSHINDCSLQQLREANYHHFSPCFFKSSVDTERNNPETRLNSPNSGMVSRVCTSQG